MKKDLKIGGFLPFTTLDFPTVSAACVVFCQGCPWRCPYCQNRDLQAFHGQTVFSWENILQQIKERRCFLEGVVFSGGEPLAQKGLKAALEDMRNLGLKTALHTSGALPQALEEVLPWLDWVGLDVKTSFPKKDMQDSAGKTTKYDFLTGVTQSAEPVLESLKKVIESNIAFECRTTVDPRFVHPEDILLLAEELRELKVPNYTLQECLDKMRQPLYSECFSEGFLAKAKQILPSIIIRRA
ncbi:anaerobic ribonucleoside-triphosphate reductase activating protein [Alphaproteobacteria bacterium]|nr:anaerobic ribonucleoside-triphosphate reductase activating protein [Alphaproteobacteria bacterium]GHT00478.1 anaerobic ribonucleoside-triphosphate reductase activating protein [Alphaproteobacteria bacterium]